MAFFVKKKELISDEGVSLTSNIIDFTVTTGCIVVIIGLIYLGVMAYIV